MDTFNEYLVKKKPSKSDNIQKMFIGIGATFLALALFFAATGFLNSMGIGLILSAAALYGGYYLMSNMEIEYEYIVTNGEVDIDKIIGRKKRKRLVTINAKDFTAFGEYKTIMHNPSNINTTIMAHDGEIENAYYAEFNHGTLGQTRLIFSPNDKIIAGIKPYLSRLIK